MHVHNTAPLLHHHSYLSGEEQHNERRTWIVAGITAAMMVLEIVCGWRFHSMALLADGWHMFTHAGTIGLAAFAYFFARTQARNPRFTFGTGKVTALGGFTSAVILVIVTVWMIVESLMRLYHPTPIVFNEAIGIAGLGLFVNLLCAWLLKDRPHSHDGHEHSHSHDYNFRAAYIHVLADAFTSVLALVALTLGKLYGWIWLDPLMGIVGSVVIAQWAYGLITQTSKVLLDNIPDTTLQHSIRSTIEKDADNQVTDLHLWQLAPQKYSAIISLVTDTPKPPHHYKSLLEEFEHLVHVTVEVNKCE